MADGKPAISALSIISPTSALPNRGATGGAFVFDASDIAALGQKKDTSPTSTPALSVAPHFTPSTSTHMWEGDPPDPNSRTEGGHGYGVGAPEKTEYPKTWTQQDAEARAVEIVQRAMTNKQQGNQNDGDANSATGTTIDPPVTTKNQMGVEVSSWKVHGTSNGVELEIIVAQDGTIVTAYPTGRVADQSGVLQPYTSIENPADPTLPYQNPKAPPGKVQAELPNPTTGKTKPYSVVQSQRPQYVRIGADGKPEWVYRGTARPGNGAPVEVEVTKSEDGKTTKKTTKTAPPKQADPPPTVCTG